MVRSTIKVCVNGFGTIGKRVAEAVTLQPDMKLVGVVKTKPDYSARLALKLGYPLYVPSMEHLRRFESAGLKVHGIIDDLLGDVDVVVDATPAGVGEKYRELYEKYDLRMIFQGGEKPHVAEKSFSTLCNYDECVGSRSLRVVSCNTTALARSICTISSYSRVKEVYAVIIRRGADPKEVKKGPINAIKLDSVRIPSHHAEDLKLVLPFEANVFTIAVVVPTTLMHVQVVKVRLSSNVSKEDVIRAFSTTPRIALINSSMGITSTAEIIEMARDLGRKRYDIPELVVWEDTISVNGNEVMWVQAVHQESIVVPENVDAIRASMGVADRNKTMEITDRSLGLGLSNLLR